jgi:CheY-like chemotaxis protein
MNALIIDSPDNDVAILFKDLNKIDTSSINTKAKINEIAACINNLVKNDKQIHIFINIEGKFNGSYRQEQKGVEILLRLRCEHKISNPVILYGFQSNQQLLKIKPEHLIINSEGCYYYQLPFDFQILKDKVFKGITNRNTLKLFLKPAFNIDAVRHQEANWWGIKQLWDIHRVILGLPKDDFSYPKKIADMAETLNSIISIFLYQLDETTIGQALNSPVSLTIPDTIYEKKANNWVSSKIEINNISNYSLRKIIVSLIYSLQKKRINKPKILQIDDQWRDGWGEIFSKMIYDEKQRILEDNDENVFCWNDFFLSLNPTSQVKDYSEENFDKLSSLIADGDFDLILLDLRLDPLVDENKATKEISGAIFLSKIKEKFRGIPVLMTTASNKIWSFQELIKLGADAYWMKSGIDNHFTAKETIENYCRFLWLIERMTDERYRLLKYFSEYVNKFEANKNIHWCNIASANFWVGEERMNGDVAGITKTLKESVLMLKNYLHQFYLGYGYNDKLNEAFVLSGLINKIAGVFENVHRMSDKEYHDGIGEFLKKRGDKNSKSIRNIRNSCSHANYQNSNWNKLVHCIEKTIIYLDTKQNHSTII